FPFLAPPTADEDPPFRRAVAVATAHHEDTHRRLAIDAVVRALEPAIEPAELERLDVDGGIAAELRLAREAAPLPAVRPRPHDQAQRALLRLGELHVVEVGGLG